MPNSGIGHGILRAAVYFSVITPHWGKGPLSLQSASSSLNYAFRLKAADVRKCSGGVIKPSDAAHGCVCDEVRSSKGWVRLELFSG